jgi:hypothetical protein
MPRHMLHINSEMNMETSNNVTHPTIYINSQRNVIEYLLFIYDITKIGMSYTYL